MSVDVAADLVEASADPARAGVVLGRLGDRVDDLDTELLVAVVAVAGASDALGDLLVEDPLALEHLGSAIRGDGQRDLDVAAPRELAARHRRGLLGIVARDVLGTDVIDDTVAALSELATDTLGAALGFAVEESDANVCVVGMGKLGGHELNVVSDVDVLLVTGDDPTGAERSARRFLTAAAPSLEVDTTLRPEGRDGPLVRTVEGYAAHWARWASAWEFQALLKARPVVGDEEVGASFAAAADAARWSQAFDADALREVRGLKARAEAAVARRGHAARDVKLGPGGIRDIEFSVQLLQLVHGRVDPELRARGTLAALTELAAGGYVDPDEAAALATAYRFLRRVEHRVQSVHLRRTHRLPADPADRLRLARSLGHRGDAERSATEAFDAELAAHRLAVRRIHEGWWFRPLLDAFVARPGRPEQAGRDDGRSADRILVGEERLAAFGFRDADRTRATVRELALGLNRRSRLLRQLLPVLLEWLSEGPDPDLGLLGLRRLLTVEGSEAGVAATFRDSAEAARRTCHLLATAPLATEILLADPSLVADLADPAPLGSRDELVASAVAATDWRRDPEARAAGLRRWHRRHLLSVIAWDVAADPARDEVGAGLSRLAEATIEVALGHTDPQVPVAVIGMGRLGGSELSYASDVDLVVVHGGAGSAGAAEAERVAAALLRSLGGATPATRTLLVDPDLRPEGRQGPLARSLDSYTVYLERWAEVWERQALLRARPVAGDAGVARGFAALVEHALWTRPPTAADEREIRRLKARVEAERIPRGVDPDRHVKLGPGGLADVEWTVQLEQWRSGVRGRSTRSALDRLVDIGALGEQDAAVLHDAHLVLDRFRDRAWLVLGEGDLVPEAADDRALLARAGAVRHATTGDEVLDAHRRVTRRARRVVERVFYGLPGAGVRG